MRGWIVAAVVVLALTGCGAATDDGRDEASTTGKAPVAAGSAVERCTERLLRDAKLAELTEGEVEATRHYVETTYCARFAGRGWVYDDGSLSIDAHTWLEQGSEEACAEVDEASEGEPAKPAKTIPCDELAGGPKTIADCALLRHVRESEVREYLDQLRRRHGSVECEDGTPLAELGAP